MEPQIASTILMVRPASFGYNAETAVNNAFQTNDQAVDPSIVTLQAQQEFDNMVETLRAEGVEVLVYEDTPQPVKPDAVFPNNWFSTHQSGALVLYPMFASNRRLERTDAVLDLLSEKGFQTNEKWKLDVAESTNQFLEGTGSLILDRPNKIAYACLSPRTDKELFQDWCQKMGYKGIAFTAKDQRGQLIYHTNVLMALGLDFVVICMDAVVDSSEKDLLVATFSSTGKKIINLTQNQMDAFAGNMLQVATSHGTPLLVLSQTAIESLTKEQIEHLSALTSIVAVEIPTIEKYGGGSARCMMAEIYLPKPAN